jgi:hypothetical protein
LTASTRSQSARSISPDPSAKRDARVVDEPVDAAVLLLEPGAELLPVPRLRDIHPAILDSGRERRRLVVEIGRDHERAFARERSRLGRSLASCSARDDDDFPLDAAHAEGTLTG